MIMIKIAAKAQKIKINKYLLVIYYCTEY